MSVGRFAAFDPAMAGLVRDLAQQWYQTPARPRVAAETLQHWDQLVTSWMREPQMPLIIRNSRLRGTVARHANGREIVYADNSPAHWCMSAALHGRCPTLHEIVTYLRAGTFPIAMMGLPPIAVYRGTQSSMNVPNLNKLGWAICHIDAVGMNSASGGAHLPLASLTVFARRLLDPRNMFVVPKDYAGLGEIPELLAVFREQGMGV